MRPARVAGLTILELMIAMSLLAVVMAAAFPLVDQMMTRFQMARDHHLAASISQARVERARQVPYGDLTLFEDSGVTVDDFGNNAPEGRFRRTTHVEVDTPVAGMTRMTVRAQICICTRWGWRRHMHPLQGDGYYCHFTDEGEEMVFLFTDYDE